MLPRQVAMTAPEQDSRHPPVLAGCCHPRHQRRESTLPSAAYRAYLPGPEQRFPRRPAPSGPAAQRRVPAAPTCAAAQPRRASVTNWPWRGRGTVPAPQAQPPVRRAAPAHRHLFGHRRTARSRRSARPERTSHHMRVTPAPVTGTPADEQHDQPRLDLRDRRQESPAPLRSHRGRTLPAGQVSPDG